MRCLRCTGWLIVLGTLTGLPELERWRGCLPDASTRARGSGVGQWAVVRCSGPVADIGFHFPPRPKFLAYRPKDFPPRRAPLKYWAETISPPARAPLAPPLNPPLFWPFCELRLRDLGWCLPPTPASVEASATVTPPPSLRLRVPLVELGGCNVGFPGPAAAGG